MSENCSTFAPLFARGTRGQNVNKYKKDKKHYGN